MFQSKAIKDPKPHSKLYIWWITSNLSDYYYGFTHKFIKNPFYQAKRLVQWYWNVFRFDYDFDGHCLFAIIEYKLIRVMHNLENGNAHQEPKDIKALKLAIKLAGRLKDDKYDEKGYDRLEKKWGKLVTWTTPCEDRPHLYTFNSKFERENTDQDRTQSSEDRVIVYAASHKKMKREEKWLYAILDQYLRNWWD